MGLFLRPCAKNRLAGSRSNPAVIRGKFTSIFGRSERPPYLHEDVLVVVKVHDARFVRRADPVSFFRNGEMFRNDETWKFEV